MANDLPTEHAATSSWAPERSPLLGRDHAAHPRVRQDVQMSTFTTRDDVTIYYKDWGPRDGNVVILSHGWPLNADSWESQAFHLASNGYRVITHDRRGHGRSSQPWDGNDMDHYADDLAQLIERLDLNRRHADRLLDRRRRSDALCRPPRHGPPRPYRAHLRGAADHAAHGEQPDRPAHRSVRRTSRSQYRQPLQALSRRCERPVLRLQPARRHARPRLVENFWLQGMTAGHKNTYDCIAAFSATDFTKDLAASTSRHSSFMATTTRSCRSMHPRAP